MSKRGMGDDFEQQAGNYSDGFASDSNTGNPFAGSGSNFGGPGVSGRKILNPKRMRGARPVTPKPMLPQPQAQAQPVSANTQGFGFTFGGSTTPAASSGGFNFGSQQPSGINFGSQQASTPVAQSSGFSSNSMVTGNPFQSNPSNPTQTSSAPGFQGNIFNIQPTNIATPKPFSPFGGFGNQSSSQPGNNMFGATPSSQQSNQDFAFGQTATSNAGFGSGSQSVSAPSSFSFGNDNTRSMGGQINTTSSTPFSFGTSTQQSTAPSASPFTFGTSAPATQSSSASSISQAGPNEQQTTTAASQPGSLFSFGSKPSAIQNPFAAASPNPQAEQMPKAPSFSLGGSAASSAPSMFSTTATTSSTSGGSLFKIGEPSNSTTSNMFAPATSQPSNATTASNISNSQDTTKQPTNMFSGLSSTTAPAPAPVRSLFGNPTPQSSTVQDVSKDAQSAAIKPLFPFKPTAVQAEPKADSAEKAAVEAKKTPLFGETMSNSSAENSKVQQKALPSFSFDTSKIGSTSSPFQQGITTQTDAGKPKDSGLFSASTSSPFQFQPSQNVGSLSSTSQAPKDTTQPLFKINPSNAASQSSSAKPLFSLAGNSATNAFSQPPTTSLEKAASTGAAGSTPFKPLFGLQNSATPGGLASSTAASEQKSQDSALQSKPLFGMSGSTSSGLDAQPKPSFVFQPHAGKPAEAAASKAPFSFDSASNISQQTSPNKALTNADSASQQINRNANTKLTAEENSLVPAIPESASLTENGSTSPVDVDTNMSDGSQVPDDASIPESFIAKWTKLRSDDLPTEEVVDILLHDWILQLEIPKAALVGMDMNQEDDLTWLWQHSAVDAAWDYHLRTWGSKDRNLMEIYRMVMTLKAELDHFHKKTWSKSDTLVNPRIFEDRYIRKMAKRNIEAWETNLKSEIKNLKKRKIDTTRDAGQDDVESANNAKRNKVSGTASNIGATSKAPALPMFQPFSQNSSPQKTLDTNASKKVGAFGGISQGDSSGANDVSFDRNNSVVSKATTSTLESQQNSSNIFGAAKPSLNQESPSKINMFNSSTRTTDQSGSPQRSKTSQLFASITNKPVEDVPVKTAPPPVVKSIFDRITRDSTGAPVREVDEPLFVPQEDGDDEEASDEHEDDEEEESEENEEEEEEDIGEAGGETDADDQNDDGEDDQSNEAPAVQSKSNNIFAQSTSTGPGTAETSSPSASRDHTWKPDSPIKFGKDTKTAPSPSNPIMGFVPKGGMPKPTQASAVPLSQGPWQAPSNPFGNFKNINAKDPKTDTETKAAPTFAMPKPPANLAPIADSSVSGLNTWKAPSNPFGNFKKSGTEEKKADTETKAAPTFTMPKPPANLTSTADSSVSGLDTWKAPSNPFGNFKKPDEKSAPASSAPPALTLTAPSPQRPAKPLFDMTSSTTAKASEPAKPLFSFSNVQPSSDAKSGEKPTQPPNMFSFSSTTAVKATSGSTESTAPRKPLFEFTKSEPTTTDTAPPSLSNHWLDFAKGINKPSSPAPSGASVFASLTTSLNPSRASSPAMSAVSTNAGDTDAEHHDDDEAPKEAQLDLGSTKAGEENEEALHTVRAKAYEFCSTGDGAKEWTVRGVGELRVLKHKDTGKVRAVLRADQSAKVLLNAGLIPSATYGLKTPKRVSFTVASASGVPAAWFIQVSKEDDATKLSALFETNKSN